YTEDATIYPPNEAPVTGRANILKHWEGAIAAGVFEVKVATESSGNKGDLGYEVGRLQMKVPLPDGSVFVENGKYTEVLKRGDDGRWRSLVGIWNMEYGYFEFE
ncbi:MAG: ketosteroid isomerase-like protein, partial [Patescibacteria group bacterium]